MTEQLEMTALLACLDFPGRGAVSIKEIAAKLGYTPRHVVGWIETGELGHFDGRGRGATRQSHRIPIDYYRDFIVRRLSGPARRELLAQLPKGTLRDLRREIDHLLTAQS